MQKHILDCAFFIHLAQCFFVCLKYRIHIAVELPALDWRSVVLHAHGRSCRLLVIDEVQDGRAVVVHFARVLVYAVHVVGIREVTHALALVLPCPPCGFIDGSAFGYTGVTQGIILLLEVFVGGHALHGFAHAHAVVHLNEGIQIVGTHIAANIVKAVALHSLTDAFRLCMCRLSASIVLCRGPCLFCPVQVRVCASLPPRHRLVRCDSIVTCPAIYRPRLNRRRLYERGCHARPCHRGRIGDVLSLLCFSCGLSKLCRIGRYLCRLCLRCILLVRRGYWLHGYLWRRCRILRGLCGHLLWPWCGE